jgi:transcriptional regulator with XRE-family HTH domain
LDATNELSEFLTSRRARVSPEEAGLPSYGRRQVPGLRREEVASLAGVSVEYYKRLERGNATGASDSVLNALADALRLDEAERAHLFDLARATSPVPAQRRRRPARKRVRPAVQQILETISSPAVVLDPCGNYVGANVLGHALFAPLFDSREQPPNSARFIFLDPGAKDFFVDWEETARIVVANLRAQSGANPDDRELSDLVGELSARSEPFRNVWAAHDVRQHQSGVKRLRHPLVGELELAYEVMELAADSGLRLAVFTAEAGRRSAEALSRLHQAVMDSHSDAAADGKPSLSTPAQSDAEAAERGPARTRRKAHQV